jgi:hypothetical protein
MNSASLPAVIADRLRAAPLNSDRRSLAQLITEMVAPVSPRTLEDWPLTWRLVNGKAVTDTRTAIEVAYRRFQAAPEYRGGRAKKTAG